MFLSCVIVSAVLSFSFVLPLLLLVSIYWALLAWKLTNYIVKANICCLFSLLRTRYQRTFPLNQVWGFLKRSAICGSFLLNVLCKTFVSNFIHCKLLNRCWTDVHMCTFFRSMFLWIVITPLRCLQTDADWIMFNSPAYHDWPVSCLSYFLLCAANEPRTCSAIQELCNAALSPVLGSWRLWRILNQKNSLFIAVCLLLGSQVIVSFKRIPFSVQLLSHLFCSFLLLHWINTSLFQRIKKQMKYKGIMSTREYGWPCLLRTVW